MIEMNTNDINQLIQILITLKQEVNCGTSLSNFFSIISPYNWRFYFSKYLNEFKARQKQFHLTAHYESYNQKSSQKNQQLVWLHGKVRNICFHFP